MTWVLANLWPLSFLTIAVVDDILFKKFHNFLFIALSITALVALVLHPQLPWMSALQGFGLALALFLPLVLIGVTGAGDMKFMMAFGLVVGPQVIFWVLIYGLFWGAIMGLIKVALDKKLFLSLTHIYNFSLSEKSVKASQKIPFTVALFLGWLTWMQLGAI